MIKYRYNKYSISARIDALLHVLQGHKVSWKVNCDSICKGDIVCETCNMVIWCRAQELSNKEINRRLEDKQPISGL